VESQGYVCDGRLLALNSYENRVYQVGIEDDTPIIAKFYRPQRWNTNQLQEEHDFSLELVEHELPVVAPMANSEGATLLSYEGFEFALYPRQGGHAPELDNMDNLLIMGRLLGRLHLIGSQREFQHRPAINKQNYGYDCVEFISQKFIPGELKPAYDSLTKDIMLCIEQRLSEAGELDYIRVHGDCHVGNILWRNNNPHLVDLDDARMAPAVQDIWMLLSGERNTQELQLSEILEGYSEFFDFDAKELSVLEVFRTLRIIQYAAWLARRWEDPAFPRTFTWFNTVKYWSEHVLELREQLAALQEQPLRLF